MKITKKLLSVLLALLLIVLTVSCLGACFTASAVSTIQFGTYPQPTTGSIKPVHYHDYILTEVVNPSCTDDGYRAYVCKIDASHTTTEVISALGHIDMNHDGVCDRLDCGVKLDGEEETENLNFFQRIIQWFKNLFAKLFGKK